MGVFAGHILQEALPVLSLLPVYHDVSCSPRPSAMTDWTAEPLSLWSASVSYSVTARKLMNKGTRSRFQTRERACLSRAQTTQRWKGTQCVHDAGCPRPSRALKPICAMLPSTLQHGRTCQPFLFSALVPLWHHSACTVGALLSKVRVTWSQKPRHITNQANSRDDLPLSNGQLWTKGDGPQHEQDGKDGVRFYHAT